MSASSRKRVLLAQEARTARAQVDQTLLQVRRRLTPRALAGEASELIAARASDTAVVATSAARKRPLLIGAGVLAGALALAVRLGVRPWRRRETKTQGDRSSSRLENNT